MTIGCWWTREWIRSRCFRRRITRKKLEHIPHTGEKLSWRNFDFEIVDMDGARIDKVLVTLKRLEEADV